MTPSLDLGPSVSFLLGKLGQEATSRYAGKLAPWGIKPKHVGLLALLSQATGDFQLEVSRRLGIAPSLLVTMADELEDLAAVTRLRDPEDRRKTSLVLTDSGRQLLLRCRQALAEVDEELLRHIRPADRKTLGRLLQEILASQAQSVSSAPPR